MYLKLILLLLPFKLLACSNFLVVLVEAPHFNYSCNRAFLKTIAKHPSNGSKNGDVGHAWIYLQGYLEGQLVTLEGGHSGELGHSQAKYFEGIQNYLQYGYANPTVKQKQAPRYEPNPCKYLWSTLYDGFFQEGAGGHRPTYAAAFPLTSDQFQCICDKVQTYDFSKYSLTEHQCCSFVRDIASCIGVHLNIDETLHIEPTLRLRGVCQRLWQDPSYSLLNFQSPDQLEASLKEAVSSGYATPALSWYFHYRRPSSKSWREAWLFPKRLQRALFFKMA